MKVLGICLNDWNTSAAAVIDGIVVAAAREERFNRERRTRRFPSGALGYCLAETGLGVDDFDAVAAPVNPLLYLDAASPAHTERARFRGELLYSYPAFLAGSASFAAQRASVLTIRGASRERRIHYVTHHDAHAALAYLGSGFERASVLTVDGFGETETCVFYDAADGAMTRLGSVPFPHSLGCFFAAITQYLGFRPFDEEWKVMGAAALGDRDALHARMAALARIGDGLSFELDLASFEHYLPHTATLFGPRLLASLGPAYERSPDGRDARFYDVAAAAQRVLEDVVVTLVRRLVERTGQRSVCLAGGVAMNCVLNGALRERAGLDRLYVPPTPDDAGGSVGAALAVARELGEPAIAPLDRADLGPAFSADEIRTTLERAALRFRETSEPARAAAQLVVRERIVGWFQGRMELGDRALGARSILAHPGREDVARRIRERVKPRETFQPFAPAVVEERAADFFEGDVGSPFMERTARTRAAHRSALAAVTHADGSARLQTVSATKSPLFHRVLTILGEEIGVPVALNTSFNVSGEPIVCTPTDAIRTFYGSGLDALVIGPFVLEK